MLRSKTAEIYDFRKGGIADLNASQPPSTPNQYESIKNSELWKKISFLFWIKNISFDLG